ncbi:hypothetical protein [Crenobacter caeni]|uniref:Lipocalin family protein n=1 Tax=Crenobacter caeni TaxID=2705474 RepID=A0A6B2KQ62_9NEIS|nr:hypothetical protein [Crenobacter caeni]NDV12376.1 hypothetical protein [Crenobacter caeni]
MSAHKTWLALLVPLALAACGGGGGGGSSGGPQTAALTGKFVDAPVEGIAYRTETLSGTTGSGGTFQYRPGETVTFSIGGVTLPPAKAGELVTPLTLAAGDSTVAVNIAQLLQTLDSNPADGIISIGPEDVQQLAGKTLAFGDPNFDTNAATTLGKPLVDETAATAHMNTSLGKQLVGTWRLNDDNAPLVLVTFMSDGSYVLSHEGEADSSGQAGIEWGKYAWNAVDGTLDTTREVDTNGEWGLSHPIGKFKASLDKDGLLTIADSVDKPTFYKLAPNTDLPLYGSWVTKAGGNDVLLSFYNTGKAADSTGIKYVLSEKGSNTCSLPDRECWGFEKGLYSWTNNLLSYKVLYDQTGDWGLSDANTGTNGEFKTLSMRIADGKLQVVANDGMVEFTQVK